MNAAPHASIDNLVDALAKRLPGVDEMRMGIAEQREGHTRIVSERFDKHCSVRRTNDGVGGGVIREGGVPNREFQCGSPTVSGLPSASPCRIAVIGRH